MYNVKSLISKIQIKITNEYLRSVNKRPFIVSRANTIGHGKYAFHWLGDNISTFDMLLYSISGIFNYNIFGVPFSGADICGFHGHATDELCARWHILGAFYPFSRNHNVDTGLPQEPWKFNLKSRFEDKYDKNRPKEGYTLHAARIGIKMRYSLMRYAYTQLMKISLGEKGAYFKPAFFDFPEDDTLLNNMEVQNSHIMVGDSIYFIPCLSYEQIKYKGYFPNANFNSIINFKSFINYKEGNKNGEFLSLDGSMTAINAFLLGGKIIPFQNTKNVLNSKDLRNIPITIIINPDHKKYAQGNIIYDNDDKDVIINRDYMDIFIKFENNKITFEKKNMPKEEYNKYNDNKVEKIIILRAKEFDINYEKIKIYMENGKEMPSDIKKNEVNDTLEITFRYLQQIQNLKYIEMIIESKKQNNNEVTKIDIKPINEKNLQNNNKNNAQKEKKNEKQIIKENNIKLVLVKIFIVIIFLMLSIIIILFVRIKSIQKKRSNYVELTGLDSV